MMLQVIVSQVFVLAMTARVYGESSKRTQNWNSKKRYKYKKGRK
jgi:hypothetical protein